jgi:hypothetical protein
VGEGVLACGVRLGVWVGVLEGRGVQVGLAVGEFVRVLVSVPVALGVRLFVGVSVGVRVWVSVGVGQVGLGEGGAKVISGSEVSVAWNTTSVGEGCTAEIRV